MVLRNQDRKFDLNSDSVTKSPISVTHLNCWNIYVSVLVFLLMLPFVSPVTSEEQYIEDQQYWIIELKKSELPLEIKIPAVKLAHEPILINNSYYDNITNSTVQNLTWINQTDITCQAGTYITCPNITLSNTLYYNVTLDLPKLPVDIYETQLKVYDNGTLSNTTRFKIFVNYDDIFEELGIDLFQLSKNYFSISIHDGELPYTYSEQISIKAIENRTMSINCTNYLKCSKNLTKTQNDTKFTATLTIPKNHKIGRSYSYIYLNTSYNTSGNITFEVNVKETQVQDRTTTIIKNRDLEDMSTEELIEFWELIEDSSLRRQQELEASNKTKEIIIEKNITKPFIANVDQIALAIETFYKKKDEKLYLDLIDTVDEMREEQKHMQINMSNMQSVLLNSEKEKLELQSQQPQLIENAISNTTNTIKQKNVIIEKNILFLIIGFSLLAILSVGYIFLYRNAWGGLS